MGTEAANSSATVLNLSGSVASIIAFRASCGKETRPNFSAYLSHSTYFASIEEMSAFSLTPCSLASLSRASSKSLSIRMVLNIVFFFSFYIDFRLFLSSATGRWSHYAMPPRSLDISFCLRVLFFYRIHHIYHGFLTNMCLSILIAFLSLKPLVQLL